MAEDIRRRAAFDAVREMLWLWPAVAVLTAFAAGFLLASPRLDGLSLGPLAFTGDAEAARGVLQLLIGTTLTVTATVFSIMVVALQLASTQFSPRSLRSFVRDRGTQATLAVLMAAVSYGVAVLLRASDGRSEAPSPAVTVAVLALVPVMAALVYFIHHIAKSIRVEQLMRSITADTLAAIGRTHAVLPSEPGTAEPEAAEPGVAEPAAPTTLPQPPPDAHALPAKASGYVQEVDATRLAEVASAHGLTIQLRRSVGEHCVVDVPVAWAWRPDGGPVDAGTCRRAAAETAKALQIGFERTMGQDPGFGLRQLVDIALRAMSPGINDPRTAIEATMQLTQLLCVLTGRQLGPLLVHDNGGTLRAVVPRPTFAGYLALACDELRRFGAREPSVTGAQLHMLEEIALRTTDPARRRALGEQAELLVAAAERAIDEPKDLAGVHARAQAVRAALDGPVPGRSRPPAP